MDGFEADGRATGGRAAGGREGNECEESEGDGNARDRAELLPSPPRSRTTDSCQGAELLLPVILLRCI